MTAVLVAYLVGFVVFLVAQYRHRTMDGGEYAMAWLLAVVWPILLVGVALYLAHEQLLKLKRP